MKNKSSIFLVNGLVDYEGSQVLGAYLTMTAAKAALEAYRSQVAADLKNRSYLVSAYDDYSITEFVVDAAAV